MPIRKIIMKKVLAIFLFIIPLQGYSHECSKWEYGNLAFNTVKKIENDELLGIQYYVFWSAPNIAGSWLGDKVLTGNVKIPLREYFKVKSINPTEIMNSLGSVGWEVYSFERKTDSLENTDHYYVGFKQCKV